MSAPHLDPSLLSHLLSLTTSIGSALPNPPYYIPGDEARDCIRDIQRYIHQDKTLQIQTQIGKWKIFEKDLLPLLLFAQTQIETKKDEEKYKGIREGTLELMETVTRQREQGFVNQQIQQEYKYACTRTNPFHAVFRFLLDPLERPGK